MTVPADNSAENTVPSLLLGDPSETIFHSLNRGGDNSDTGRWLTSLVSDALEIAAHGDSEQPVTDDDIHTMVRWVAQLFNEFELYKIEFNSKAAGSDLIVVASPLNLENLSSTHDHFEAHLSTRYWSLAFDASTRKLDAYLIPAELLLAFTTSAIEETEYKPFVTFVPRRHSDQYYWTVDKQQITFEMLPDLAKELFGDLIRVASGNMTEQEFFDNSPNHLAEAADPKNMPPLTDRSFESEVPGSSVFASTGGGTVPAKIDQTSSDQESSSSSHAEQRATALTPEIFRLCESFSGSLDKEMHTIIEFAKTQPDDVSVLLSCKQILTELDSLRVATNRTAERLRELAKE